MAIIYFFFIFLILTSVLSQDIAYPNIYGGVEVKPGEIPYQASLRFKNGIHFCGGVILNEFYIITAAHCVIDKVKKNIRIGVGSIDVHKPKSVHNVILIYIHKSYRIPGKPIKRTNDIALLKVDPSFQFDDTVAAVVLPEPHLEIPKNTKARVSGWGNISKSKVPKLLKKLEVTVIDQEDCINAYKQVNLSVYPEELCTHETSSERLGACIGDSGGPLVINNNVLIGIVSWSKKDPVCGSPTYPDVYTRIPEYIDWIKINAI